MPAGCTHETAGDRNGLSDVAGDEDRDPIGTADAVVSRIKRDPSGTGHVNFCPGVG